MIRMLLYVYVLSCPLYLMAQQRAQYSQYVLNNYLLNPAISGIEDYTDIKIGYRNQWTGVEGAPVTYYVSGHTKLGTNVNVANNSWTGKRRPAYAAYQERNHKYQKIKPHHGIGAMLLHDRIGPFGTTELSFTYAYHLLLSQRVKLSTGVGLHLVQQAFRGSALRLTNPNDNAATDYTIYKPDVSAGLWLYSDDFYVGASAAQLLGNALKPWGNQSVSTQFQQHYFLTGAYKIRPTPMIALIPAVVVKWAQPAPVSVDYNFRVSYADRVWAGVSYRQRDALAFLTGFTLNYTFDVGYSYDTGVSSLGNASRGSHEILLGIRLHNRFKVLCPQNMW